MTKIDIFSGFLGAGKTTLIKKLIKEAYAGEKVVLIENEFGEIGIDGGFLQDAGIQITEMNSGCICCSLVGDFAKALKKVSEEYHPDRIVIEPSGVGKLRNVIKAVAGANLENAELNSFCTVVDAGKCKLYMKNFGEFFDDQVESAGCIVLSHTDGISEEKLATCVSMLRQHNPSAVPVTASGNSLTGKDILAAMEQKDSLRAEMERLRKEFEEEEAHGGHEHHHHHHDHDDDDDECCHHHHDHDDDHGDECCHHHHDHDDDDEEGEGCGCHHHGHGHHHADDVFASWGTETTRRFGESELKEALEALMDEKKYGTVLRAKGIVPGEGEWLHFDYVPGEPDVRRGSAAVTGRLCVIGCDLKEDALKELFKA